MTEIPNAFGGFAPFPNTIMIPTMGLQSDVIGFRFGFGYEKGKRTLRAMSNEQFNNLDEEAEQAIYKRHDTIAIHFFELELQNWTNLQKLIIEKSVEIEVMKAIRTPSAFREMFEGFTKGFSEQQKQDAGKFFGSLKETIMQMMAWFSGHKPKIESGSGKPVGEHEFLTSAEAAEHKAHGHLGGGQPPSPSPSEKRIKVTYLAFVFNSGSGFPLKTTVGTWNKTEFMNLISSTEKGALRLAKTMGVTPGTNAWNKLQRSLNSMKAQLRWFP